MLKMSKENRICNVSLSLPAGFSLLPRVRIGFFCILPEIICIHSSFSFKRYWYNSGNSRDIHWSRVIIAKDETVTKGQMLYHSTYAKYLEWSNSKRQESRMVVPWTWGEEELGVSSYWVQSFSWGRWKNSGDGWWWWLYNSVNVLNAAELPLNNG